MSDDARHPDPDPDPRTSWTARRGPLLAVALIVGISPFATDLHIPGLPAIATDLDASTASVQLTLTAFLVAFAARGRPRRHRDRDGRADDRLHRGRSRRAALGVPRPHGRMSTVGLDAPRRLDGRFDAVPPCS
jgi:hypothetical protein